MRAVSSSTSVSDPYRAGVELGEALAGIAPEVVLLFTSIHYADGTELLDGLHDVLANPDLIVVGNTGDGIYETHEVSPVGASALGIRSQGVRWASHHAVGVSADPVGVTRECLARVRELTPELVFLAADFRTDSTRIEEAIADLGVPLVGGLAADDNRLGRSFVFHGREALEDGVVALGASGDIRFDIVVGNALRPVGTPGVVSDATGIHLRRIDGLSAMEFIEREIGRPPLPAEHVVFALGEFDPAHPELKRLRSIVPEPGDEGATRVYGSIAPGQRVQVCIADPDELVQEAYAMARRSHPLGYEPSAALVVSCTGRRWVLGNRVEHELLALSREFAGGLPMAGYFSFGEFAPMKQDGRFTRNFAHNMTCVLCLIGEPR